jgi:hypothetical protein
MHGSSEPAAAPAGLLAYDDFEGRSGGFGWARCRYPRPADAKKDDSHWTVAFHMEDKYAVQGKAPLTYRNLLTTPRYMHHTNRFRIHTFIGRVLDTKGGLAAYRSGDAVGAPGKTLWMSILMRLEEDRGEPFYLATWMGPLANASDRGGTPGPTLCLGTHKKRAGNLRWTLFEGNPYEHAMAQSNKPAVVGKASLLVMKFDFRDGGTDISLYVDPQKLGGTSPERADAKLTTSKALTFNTLVWSGMGQPSSIDELRIGSEFAAVTPVADKAAAPGDAPKRIVRETPFRILWHEEDLIDSDRDPGSFSPVGGEEKRALAARLGLKGKKLEGPFVYRCSVYYSGMELHRLTLEGDRLIVEIDKYKHPHGSRRPPPEGKQDRFSHYVAVASELKFDTYEMRYITVAPK